MQSSGYVTFLCTEPKASVYIESEYVMDSKIGQCKNLNKNFMVVSYNNTKTKNRLLDVEWIDEILAITLRLHVVS
jgi:hypothetical protein